MLKSPHAPWADPGDDFMATDQTLSFTSPGSVTEVITQSQVVSVPIIGDTTWNLDESFLVELFDLDAGGRDVRVVKPQERVKSAMTTRRRSRSATRRLRKAMKECNRSF